MKNRVYIISGIIAPLLYAGFVVLGGYIRTDYSFISQTVSQLNQARAPHKLVFDMGFALSNICMAIFGYGLFRNGRSSLNKYKSLSGRLLILSGIIGFLMVILFPADPPDVPLSTAGFMHHTISWVLALLAMMAIHFSELSIKQSRRFEIYSRISILVIFISATATIISGMTSSRYMGILERITIGVFLQWMIVVSHAELKESLASEQAAAKRILTGMFSKTRNRI